MKNVHVLCLSFFLLHLSPLHSQSDSQNYLWKISGEDLAGPSFLFGSIHVNEREAFQFDDSLFYALSSCIQFANEVNGAIVDSTLMVQAGDILMSKLNEPDSEDDSGEDSGKEKNPSSIFEDMNPEGMPTFLDLYLYRAAMGLGLSPHGLERIDDQIDLMEALGEYDMGTSRNSRGYEQTVEAYTGGNSAYIEQLMSQGDDLLEMEQRNQIQAKSFVKLAKTAPTFAVVGVGHLLGEQSVLEILENEGYLIEQVGRGKPTKQIDSLYALPKTQGWNELTFPQTGTSLLSNLKIDLIPIDNKGFLHMSIEMELGLIYVSAVFNTPGQSPEELAKKSQYEFFPDTSKLVVEKERMENGMKIRDFSNFSDKNSFRARIATGNEQMGIQLVVGFASSSLQHPHVDHYFEGITYKRPDILELNTQYIPVGAFEYLFPDGIPLQSRLQTHGEFPERGEALILYSTYTHPQTGDEYLVKFNNLPSGITYIDPYASLQQIMDALAINFESRVDQMEYTVVEGNLSADATLLDSLGSTYYIRALIRGANAYLFLQKSLHQRRDSAFFNSLQLREVSYEEDSSFLYPDAKFSMKTPSRIYHYTEEEEGVVIDNYSMNVANSGVSMDLEFEQASPYEEVSLADSLFTIENMLEYDSIDSLIYFRPISYKGVCPGYSFQHLTDSTFLLQTEYEIFCNQHRISLQVISPQSFMGNGYANEVWESIVIELDSNSVSTFSERKAGRILADLYAQDSATFTAAAQAFDYYTDFTDKELPILIDLLNSDLWGEEKEKNVKYGLISDLHNFSTPEVERTLEAHFLASSDPDIRGAILQSLSLRDTDSSLIRLFELLPYVSESDELPEDLYTGLRDSVELLERYYPQVKELASMGILEETCYSLLVEELEKEHPSKRVLSDSSWLQKQVLSQIDHYIQRIQTDSSTSIDAYIMDYLLLEDLGEKEAELRQVILNSEDTYGKYRVAHKKLQRGEKLTDPLVSDVMESDYYRYWLTFNYQNYDQILPAAYADKGEIARSIMKMRIYDDIGLWCDSCTYLREVTDESFGTSTAIFMKCQAEEEGAYYLGCVGLFDAEDSFQFEGEVSSYYEQAQTAEDPETLIDALIEHMKGQLAESSAPN